MTYVVTFSDEEYEQLSALLRFCGPATSSLLGPLEAAEYQPSPQEKLAFDIGAAAVREQEAQASFWFKR